MRSARIVQLLVMLALGSVGCQPATEPVVPIWEQVKIGQIAPGSSQGARQAKYLATVNLDVYILDLPAQNLDKLDSLWQRLTAKPIQTNSYSAFAGNSFRVRLGRTTMWEEIRALLREAGAQDAGTTSLVIGDDKPADLPVASVPQNTTISFVGMNLIEQTVQVGPGVLALRLREQQIPGARGVRKIVAYPVHTLPLTSTIPELESQTRRREFYFAPAAFASQMTPGDLLVLAPGSYSGEQVSLGGLFFNRSKAVLFFDPQGKTPPQQRPAVRVFALVCTRIND